MLDNSRQFISGQRISSLDFGVDTKNVTKSPMYVQQLSVAITGKACKSIPLRYHLVSFGTPVGLARPACLRDDRYSRDSHQSSLDSQRDPRQDLPASGRLLFRFCLSLIWSGLVSSQVVSQHHFRSGPKFQTCPCIVWIYYGRSVALHRRSLLLLCQAQDADGN